MTKIVRVCEGLLEAGMRCGMWAVGGGFRCEEGWHQA